MGGEGAHVGWTQQTEVRAFHNMCHHGTSRIVTSIKPGSPKCVPEERLIGLIEL